MAAPSFSKDPFSFSIACYLQQFYGLKDFITVFIYIIDIALEQLEVNIIILSLLLIPYVFKDQLEMFVTLQL